MRLAFLCMALAGTALAGCVSSREVVIRVRDADRNTPLRDAHIEVSRRAVFAKLNAQAVQQLQSGETDAAGDWHGRCADGGGWLRVSASGYGAAEIQFGDDWRWPKSMAIALQRLEGHAGTSTASPP